MDKYEIRELLGLSQKGDSKAYHDFLTQVIPLISQIINIKVFNVNDREDVVQNVLIGIHRSLHTYDIKREVIPWVKAITHKKIIDYIRKKMSQLEKEVELKDFYATNQDRNTNLILKEQIELVYDLPDKYKKPIILTKLDGYSTKEVAEQLKINENALRTRISRGYKMLKEKIENNIYES